MKLYSVYKLPNNIALDFAKPLGVLLTVLLSACAPITDVLPNAGLANDAAVDSAATIPDTDWANKETLHIKVVAILTAVPGGGERTRKVRLTWERIFADDEVYDIVEIKNPLGNTHARLENSKDSMEIFIAGKPAAATPEVQQLLKALPPPQAMGYWLLGASDPNHSTHEIFTPGIVGVEKIIQHGWEITYQKRDSTGRPQRIHLRPVANSQSLSSDTPPDAEATLEITRWLPTS
ncbi:MAG: lipoprotein insertase outer membrane protein LolB [Gammaproteobacteria bacterium WSBS_2016_MAG_OTU1]